jgi:predicted metalloendopeptidase
MKRIVESDYPVDDTLTTFVDKENDKTTFNKMQTLYKACMDESTADANGVDLLRKLLVSLQPYFPIVVPVFPGGKTELRTRNLLSALVASDLRKAFPLFTVSVGPSPKEAGVNIPTLYPSGIGLPAKDLYKDASFTNVYKKVIAKTFETVGVASLSKKSFEELASRVVDFETKIATFSPSM